MGRREELWRRARRCLAADPLLVAFIGVLAFVAVMFTLMVNPDGQPSLAGAILQSTIHRLNWRDEDAETIARVMADLGADAREAALAVDAIERNRTAAPVLADVIPKPQIGTVPPQAPGLPNTVSSIYLPASIGPYNLTHTCRKAVLFLHGMDRTTGSNILHTAVPTPSPSNATTTAPSGAAADSDPTVLDGPHPSHPLYQALDAARDKTTNTVIVAFASIQYHKIVLNWVLHMRKLNIQNVLLLALDSPSANLLKVDADGMVTMALIQGGAMDRYRVPIFMIRYHIFTYALCAGINVIMSDVDAIWLHNPIQPYMLETPNDCVFSGDGMPGELRAKWNMSTTICFGFIFCRANERSLALAAAGQRYLPDRQDDQVAINYGLDELTIAAPGLIPDPPLPTAPQARDIYAFYERSYHGVTAEPVSLAFTILSRSIVTRHCGLSFHASTWRGQVAHCIVKQVAEDKEEMLRMKGLWLAP